MRISRRSFAVAAVLTLTGGMLAAIPMVAAADVTDCGGNQIDDRPVVVTIHGFNGNPQAFGDEGPFGSMNQSIELLQRKFNRVKAFDYSPYNNQWVTNPHIGQALAQYINCLSAASVRAGGDGKVVTVAHSMGGLALREALNRANQHYVSPWKIGLAIDIGTPHRGSPLAWLCHAFDVHPCTGPAATAMVPGSAELKALPSMPRHVPLRAIAGRVVGYDNDGRSDYVVTVNSATAEYTTRYPGDGRHVVSCYQLWPLQAPSCNHLDQLRDVGIQANVVSALAEYRRSLRPAPPTPTCTPTASPTPTPSDGEIGGTGETGGGGEIGGVGGGPSATPAEPSPTVTPSQPSCA